MGTYKYFQYMHFCKKFKFTTKLISGRESGRDSKCICLCFHRSFYNRTELLYLIPPFLRNLSPVSNCSALYKWFTLWHLLENSLLLIQNKIFFVIVMKCALIGYGISYWCVFIRAYITLCCLCERELERERESHVRISTQKSGFKFQQNFGA